MSHRRNNYILTAKKLMDLMGSDVIFHPGLIVQKDFSTKNGVIRFLARYDGNGTFTVKVASVKKEIWSGQIEVADNFPGIERFVAGLDGVEMEHRDDPGPIEQARMAPEENQKPVFADDLASVQQIPHQGEVWVMNCIVEQSHDHEIRYRAVDSYGQSYGAPRILPKEEFYEIFTEISHGVYQLSVQVIKVGTDSITYVKLNADKQPSGEQKVTKLAPFVASFIPEATCY